MPDRNAAPRHTNNSPVARARIRAGLTQEQLAEMMGVKQNAVSNWERLNPKLSTLRKIAAALKISVTELIEE